MNNTKHLGVIGENVIEGWLQRHGFKILAKNFSCRCGEIDLIATKNEVIAFVEVKTRSNEYFPTSSVVTKSKQTKIIKTAKLFVLQNELFDFVLRFDVATVTFEASKPAINYIPNAFTI